MKKSKNLLKHTLALNINMGELIDIYFDCITKKPTCQPKHPTASILMVKF